MLIQDSPRCDESRSPKPSECDTIWPSEGTWPELLRRPDASGGQAASAGVPVPRDCDPAFIDALRSGAIRMDGCVVQAQPIGWWEGQAYPRRLMLRWIGEDLPPRFGTDIRHNPNPARNAGWTFEYRWVEGIRESVPWRTRLRNAPLEETEYEMHQLDLRRGDDALGLRLGLRLNARIYWWQFIRADFVHRGPVCDVLRVGGPIYNEESTVQSDAYLVLYANGVIEAYVHFVNHQREGVGTETHGIPVLAFDVPGDPQVNHVLDGTETHFRLGACSINLGESAGFADAERPGSLRTEEDVIVWQPWLDQEIFGELLVEAEGIPEHRIIRGVGEGQNLTSDQRGEADRYWVAALGDRLIPRGVARSVRFILSSGDVPPEVVRYQAPAWWHALCESFPTSGKLPAAWWTVPHALEVGEQYFRPHPRGGPFELGRSGRDSDGTLGAAMLLLGYATERTDFCEGALLPAYWWADIAIDHVEFTCHELPKYSWQWIVQPYIRWIELVYAYGETSDPYLLETARFTADAYYRFFWTNRPHRTVGRDALGVAGLLALYESTGEVMYLQRAREILAEARRSYGQTDAYWPGGQSGCGPNGVGRQDSFDYIPMVLARLHVQLIETARGTLPPEEEDAVWRFLRFIVEVVREKGGGGWTFRAVSLSYMVLTALADHYPDEAETWIGLLNRWNEEYGMPEAHDGGKAYSWVVSALRLDAWAWGATWEDGVLRVRPRTIVKDPRAPKRATVWTPKGKVELVLEDGTIRPVGDVPCAVEVEEGLSGA